MEWYDLIYAEPGDLLGAAVGFGICLLALIAIQFVLLRRNLKSPVQYDGHGIEVKDLAARLQRVRKNYTAEMHAVPKSISYRRGLVAMARRALQRLSFFQRPEKDRHSGN